MRLPSTCRATVSFEPPEAWSTLQYAEWVAPVLDELAGGPIVVAGHSFGGRVAVRLATGAEGAQAGTGVPAPSC